MNWSWSSARPDGSTQAPDAADAAPESARELSTAALSLPPFACAALPIKLVEQTTDFNCGAAALAMILGLSSPEQVEGDHLGRDTSVSHADRGIAAGQIGVFMDEVQRVLFEAGIPALPYVNRLRRECNGAWECRIWDRVRVADHDFLRRHLARGGVAMLTVPSLNTPGGDHWIVVVGDKVFDPSSGRKYRSWSEIPSLSDAILVGDRSALRR